MFECLSVSTVNCFGYDVDKLICVKCIQFRFIFSQLIPKSIPRSNVVYNAQANMYCARMLRGDFQVETQRLWNQ